MKKAISPSPASTATGERDFRLLAGIQTRVMKSLFSIPADILGMIISYGLLIG
jgi:hypothetical protein